MRRFAMITCGSLLLIFGAACSGTDNGGSDSSSSGRAPNDMFLIGTCFESASGGGADTCQESWTGQGRSIKSQLRDQAGNNCEDMAGDEWTRAEAVCPTGSDYIGTCIFRAANSYTENYFYQPNSDARQGCETAGGEWIVE